MGFKVDDVPSCQYYEEDYQNLEIIKNHLRRMCNNNEDIYIYVCRWFNALFKYPGLKNQIFILFSSAEGLGKDQFFELIKSIIGSKYCSNVVKPKKIFGDFNGLVLDKILILLNEIKSSNYEMYLEDMKQMISCEDKDIEKKGLEVIEKPNFSHYMGFSNEEIPLNLNNNGNTPRRNFSVRSEVEPPIINDPNYFVKFVEIRKNEKYQRMFYDYIVNDCNPPDNFNWINDKPETVLDEEMKQISQCVEHRFIEYFMNSKRTQYNDYYTYHENSLTSETERSNLLKFSINCSSLFYHFKKYPDSKSYTKNDAAFGIKLTKIANENKIIGFSKTNINHSPLYHFDIIL